MSAETIDGLTIAAPVDGRYAEILTPEALALLAEIHRAFDPRRHELLERRKQRQAELDAGAELDFLEETRFCLFS